jgi:hypothetical protein
MQNKRFKPLERVNGWITAIFFIAVLLFAAKGTPRPREREIFKALFADGTGAVIQNASVTATNIATQVKHVAKRTAAASIAFRTLPSALIPWK